MRIVNQAGHRRLTIICGLGAAVFSIAACAGKDAPPASTGSAAAAAAASTATTSAATPNGGASAAQVAADQHNMATYPLTVEHVTEVGQVMRTIQSLEKSDPALKAAWQQHNAAGTPATIDEAVARVASAPRAPEILKSAGISAHDYVYTTFALMYASAAYQMQKARRSVGASKVMKQVAPANIDFVAKHQKEIQALSAIDSGSNPGGN